MLTGTADQTTGEITEKWWIRKNNFVADVTDLRKLV
jgi:hypothetical protein